MGLVTFSIMTRLNRKKPLPIRNDGQFDLFLDTDPLGLPLVPACPFLGTPFRIEISRRYPFCFRYREFLRFILDEFELSPYRLSKYTRNLNYRRLNYVASKKN